MTRSNKANGEDKGRAARQRTLKAPISCNGIGLHSGAKVSLTLRPGEPDSGIVFHRTDIAGGGVMVPGRWDWVVDTTLCTAVGDGEGARISTVEHLMAALAGCQIDNAVIEVSGPELPIMDGSSAPFVFLIECAGTSLQETPRRAIKVLKPVTVSEGESSTGLFPADAFSVDFEIEFDSPLVARQECSVALSNGTFKTEISRARTFGFLDQVEMLRARGLARGGSLENAVVVCGERILNEEGLRYEDEFVRHKVLDCVGDLYLAGRPILGRFVGVRSGHLLTNRVLAALFADDSAWETVTLPMESELADVAPVRTLTGPAIGRRRAKPPAEPEASALA